jgi:hypothetical protein
MPLHGTNIQLDASRYFESYFSDDKKPLLQIHIDDNNLEKLIDEQKNTLDFINSVYEECFNAKNDSSYDSYILETIASYKNINDETLIYEKSEYYVFDMDGYFIDTKEGNTRNWIYSFEIEEAYNKLKETIEDLDNRYQV